MVNLIVATVPTIRRPSRMSIEKAAKGVIHGGKVDQGLLKHGGDGVPAPYDRAFAAPRIRFARAKMPLNGHHPRRPADTLVQQVRRRSRV